MVNKVLLVSIMVFSIFGMFLASSLSFAKYNDKIASLCGETVDNGCNVVQNSEYSYLFNIKNDDGTAKFQLPLSMAGLLFYIILFALSITLYWRAHKSKKSVSNLKYFLFFIGMVGIMFSIAYTWIQAYKIEAFCTYCLISAFNTVVLFALIVMITFGHKFKSGRKIKN